MKKWVTLCRGILERPARQPHEVDIDFSKRYAVDRYQQKYCRLMSRITLATGKCCAYRFRGAWTAILCLVATELVMATQAAPAAEFKCDDRLTPASTTPYEKRGNRCEGLYRIQPTADATMTLVGYFRGRFHYTLDESEKILLRVPDDIPAEFSPVEILGSPYSYNTYYRMNSLIDRAGQLEWPVGDVLRSNTLTDNKIGVFGVYHAPRQAGSVAHAVHVPLQARSTTYGDLNDKDTRLYLSASQKIEYLESQWYCENQDPVIEASYEIVPGSNPIRVFPPRHLRGKCHAHFFSYIDYSKRDAGGEGNLIKLDLILHLGAR